MSPTETAAALRAWAAGSYTSEAAVELVIRAFGGQLLDGPWIAPASGARAWFDAAAVAEAGYLSGGQRRVLQIAASVAEPGHSIDLADVLPGLDRDAAALVLAAIAHAAGTHEHGDIEIRNGAMTNHGPLPSLYPWPAATPPLRLVQGDHDADT